MREPPTTCWLSLCYRDKSRRRPSCSHPSARHTAHKRMVAPGVVQRQYCQPTPTRGLLQRPFKPLALGWCPVLCYSQRLLRKQEETFFPSCVFA